MRKTFLVLACSFAFLAALASHAMDARAGTTGGLVGRVLDAAGAGIGGVKVNAVSAS